MVGYSELVNTMAAMVIFSMILLSANRMIQRNTVMQVQGELEQEVVALAQDIIEEARTKYFDEETVGSGADALPSNIPADFTLTSALGNDTEAERKDFDDFDDYNGWTDILETEHGEFVIRTRVFYVDKTTFKEQNAPSTFKKIQVYITSKYLTNSSGQEKEYYLEFIRNYYAE